MISAAWPVILPILGLVLIAFCVGLGYTFQFVVGTIVGVVLLLLAFVGLYFAFAVGDGMGSIVIVGGGVTVGPILAIVIGALARAGDYLKHGKQKEAKKIIAVITLLWMAIIGYGLLA